MDMFVTLIYFHLKAKNIDIVFYISSSQVKAKLHTKISFGHKFSENLELEKQGEKSQQCNIRHCAHT